MVFVQNSVKIPKDQEQILVIYHLLQFEYNEI